MWRVHFMVGAMAHAMCSAPMFAPIAGDTADMELRMRRLVTFLSAGFRAPATAGKEKSMRWAWVLLFTLPLAGAPVELSLKRAVQLAISPEGNTRVQLSAEALKQAESRSVQARAALLPDVSGAFTDAESHAQPGGIGDSGDHTDTGLPVAGVRRPVQHDGCAGERHAEHFRFQQLSGASRRRRWA